MAGDHAHVRGRRAERPGDLGISLWRWFVALGRVIDAESAIKQVNYPTMGNLAVILPISGRMSSSAIAGILCTVRAPAAFRASGAHRVSLYTSRRHRAT